MLSVFQGLARSCKREPGPFDLPLIVLFDSWAPLIRGETSEPGPFDFASLISPLISSFDFP